MKRINFLVVAIALVFCMTTKVYAQCERKVQFTFFYPFSTSGFGAKNCSYNFSFNTIWGITGGVDGCELASVGNIVKGNVSGTQIAGVFNTTTGSSKGAVISGVANITGENANGAMISGVLNTAQTIKGLQLSTINIASELLDGMQTGVINIAKKGKGLQLGVVNIGKSTGDSILPIGLFNIFRDGYYALELSTNEMLFTTISFKMGIEKLYTIFRFGIGFRNDSHFFSSGGGLGAILPINSKSKINIEAICSQFYENDFKHISDILSQINLDYQYNLTKHWAVKFGPTLNCFVEKKNKTKDNDAVRVPYTIIEGKSDNHITSIWIGANAGLVFKF